MDTFINFVAKITGLWKKVALLLPLIAGTGSVLVGLGNLLVQVASSPDAATAVKAISGLNSQDPNVHLILVGLLALGIHTNHAEHAEQIQSLKKE